MSDSKGRYERPKDQHRGLLVEDVLGDFLHDGKRVCHRIVLLPLWTARGNIPILVQHTALEELPTVVIAIL